MDYEKRYNKALQRAKYALTTDMDNSGHWAVNYIFPELKESKDERIRKGLVKAFGTIGKKDWGGLIVGDVLTWLEKQGKQTHAELGQSEVTKASDQEPKFSVGDWITDGYVGGQITSIEENYPCYKIVDFMGINTSIPFTIQDNYHLWTIQDAKDGDVLAYVTDEEDLWIMIYWSLYEPYEGHVHYHALLVNNDFSDKGTCCICIDNLIPATKEQRDLLFQKMKDAGYEWDAEWKGLKKIESKKLDAAEVIAWLNHRELMSDEFINRFKKYFGL